MFLNFYRLRDQPFGVTPDPRYLYFSPGHREALASLFYGIETGRGFLSLVAEPGMGKTTLLFQLLQRWKGYVHSAFLFQTQCSSRELIRYLLDDLGLKSDGEDVVKMHSELNDFLFRETKAGRRVVVFIDEAQNLADEVLETVRLLSDFEAPDKKLLQIILAGQPELAQRLSRPGLAQLRQRISIPARLEALPPAEVCRYVQHRLRVAGHEGPDLFSPDAQEVIAMRSRGIPRLINNLCFNALSLGCAMQKRQIDAGVVEEAAQELSMGFSAPKPQLPQQGPRARAQVGGLRSSFEASYRWIHDSFIGRRLLSGAAVLLAIGGLGIFLGTRTRSATVHPTTVSDLSDANSSGTHNLEPQLEPGLKGAPIAQPSPESLKPGAGKSSTKTFIYVIQPQDTLRDLCVSMLGRYDDTVLSEIRQLNPQMKDFNHLDVGQAIRLPLSITR